MLYRQKHPLASQQCQTDSNPNVGRQSCLEMVDVQALEVSTSGSEARISFCEGLEESFPRVLLGTLNERVEVIKQQHVGTLAGSRLGI